MNTKLQICIYCFFICLGCQHNTKQGITIQANNNTTTEFSDLFSNIDIIPLETTDSCLISSTNKIIWHKDRIFILDKAQQTLFVFDKFGKFSWKLNKVGRGPEEYLSLEDVVINPETENIEVISPTGQYIIYNPKGNFIQSYKIPISAIHCFLPINKDLTAFYEKVGGKILIYSKEKNKIIRETPMSEEFILRNTPYHFIVTPFSYFDGEALFLAADQKKIYNISQTTGEISERYSFNLGEHDHDLRVLPTDKEMMYYITENKDQQKIYCISDFKETTDLLIIYYLYDRFWHTTFYNKANKKMVTLNKQSGIMIYYPFDCNSQFLTSVIPANIIDRQIKREWTNDQEWQKTQQIPIDANPIVLKYNFK